jgi:signal transduction histidine kinase/ActR/RegA family two-component response regulator
MEQTSTAGLGAQTASGRPARDHAFRLLRYFSITGGIAILLVAFVLSWANYNKEISDQVEATEERNVVVAQTFANAIWPQFGTHLLSEFTTAKQVREDAITQKLKDTLTTMARRVPVSKVKIYNTAGIAMYSSDFDEIGEDEKGNIAFFQVVRTGKPFSELTRRGNVSGSEQQIEGNDVVSTYIPIARDNGEVEAVFEIYSDVTDTLASIEQAALRLLFVLVAILAALYVILLLIVAAADRILRRQFMALKDNEELIEAKNRALESEIEARRAVEAALRISEEAAAAANRAKSEFLSNMSHELRTPMNAILGFTQLLMSEPTAPLGDMQRSFADQILKAGKHLLELINEVLDLARVEAGKLVLSVESVPIASVVADCLPLIQNIARDMKLQVEAPPADIAVSVMADNMRLKQVLLNLLSNAVKYNRSGGKVSISIATRGAGRARINVSDTGLGIPESRHGDLFRPFSRLVAESSVIEGTGIGLALTRNLVIAMGGTIGFESVVGSGTTFWIEFPLAPAAPTAADVESRVDVATEGGSRAQGSILYIEDNPANVMLLEHIAKRMSIRFITANNAELGIALAASQQPDLIVMDINLPQLDGYQALIHLKQNPATASIPVIALSANAMENDVKRGLAAGFLRYHTKPIDVEEMARSISQMLGERK